MKTTTTKHGVMQLKYDLSTIMRRAHELFKNRFFNETFADCLRNAWNYAKSYMNIGKTNLTHGVTAICLTPAMSMADPIAADYANGTNGRTYFGD